MAFSPTSKPDTTRHREKELEPRLPRWADLVATALHVGHIKPGPGTYGAAIGVLIWLGTARLVSPVWQIPIGIVVALLVAAIGIPAASLVERATGKEDPSYVIVDEIAGQLFALIGCPVHWKAVLAGFILFRLFDITKPFPLRRLEHLREGYGIVMDDIGAGLYALVVLQTLTYFGFLR